MDEEVEVSNSFFRKTKTFVLAATPIFLVTAFLFPIAFSGLSGDDIPNSMRSASLQANDWTRWEFIKLLVAQWKTNEGRFFPISTIESVFLFDFIHSVFVYKLLQLLATVVLLTVAAVFTKTIVGTWRLFPLTLFVLLSCIQTRNWYDPTLSFALLLQSVQIKILLCLCALYGFVHGKSNKEFWFLGASVTLWVAALLQYEVVITLFPALLILIFFSPRNHYRKLTGFVFLGLPTVLYLWYVSRLRAGVPASPAYTFKTDLGDASLTYLKQLSGGIPFSALIWSRGAVSLPTAVSGISFLLLFLLTATICLAVTYRSTLANVPTRCTLMLLAIGFNFVLGPALTTAVSARWQTEVEWGLSYLSVSFTYTGVAFIALSFLMMSARWSVTRPMLFTIFLNLYLVFFALSAISNQALLRENVRATELSKNQRHLFVSAVKEGFLSEVPDGSVIVYPLYDENFWINEYFTEWLGGPEGIEFVKSPEEAANSCISIHNLKECKATYSLDYVSTTKSQDTLSLVKVETGTNIPRSEHWYFGLSLDSQKLDTICLGAISKSSRSEAIYSCR